MVSRKAIGSVSLVFILLLSVEILYTTPTQENRDESKAETLLAFVGSVKRTAEDVLDRFEKAGREVPPEAGKLYSEGISLAQEASVSLEAGNYSEASTGAIGALQMFKQALAVLEEAMPEKLTSAEVASEKIIKLRTAIDRTYQYTERLEDLADRAEVLGYDVTATRRAIREARRHLKNAIDNLEQWKINDASRELASAKALLDQSTKEQARLAHDVKVLKTEEFMVKTENRLALLRANITAASTELPQEVRNASLAALARAENSLESARLLMTRGMVDESVDELVKARESEEESREYLEAAATTIADVERVHDPS